MLKEVASGLLLALMFVNTLSSVLNIRPAHALNWSHYHSYSEIVGTLLYLNESYPNLVGLYAIGESWQNRTIYCIRLTNESDTHAKPKILLVGYHHAREPITAELLLYFAIEAVTNYGTNSTMMHMLDHSEIYVVVALNVDGFDIVNRNEWQRKNAHPCDEDGDGQFDEDPPDDEDGDGYIEDLFQLRNSRWVFVRWEGSDNDGDGLLNEDWIGGVDLNRNYDYQWDAKCDSGSPNPVEEDFRGLSPFSEPETQAMRDLAVQNNFTYALSFHSGTEVILYPWAYTNTPTANNTVFMEIAGNLSKLVGVPYEQSDLLYTSSGSWEDWMYGNRSVFGLTCEIYKNDTAWQYEPGPYPNSQWEKGVFEFFNPAPGQIEEVIQRWLPAITYLTNRAISEQIHVPADINGDGFVNMLDLSIVAVAYGSKPGEKNWNETADLDKNGHINIIDAAMVAKDYGKTV